MITSHDLLDTGEVALMLGIAPATLRSMRAQRERHRRLDGMPEPIRMISGRPVWRTYEVCRWLAR
jgi:predicted DNA-binding transcriptional regulator AlpA